VDNIRDRILEISLKYFEERGYAGVSLRDVAEELGLTKAALYYHFPSKQGIVEAVIRESSEQSSAARAQIVEAPPEAVLETLRGYIRIYVDHQRVMTWLTSDMTVVIDRTIHSVGRRRLGLRTWHPDRDAGCRFAPRRRLQKRGANSGLPSKIFIQVARLGCAVAVLSGTDHPCGSKSFRPSVRSAP
jgi:AcrR family transcriptional regulator